MEKLDKLAENIYGEFGFATCTGDQQDVLLSMAAHEDLLDGIVTVLDRYVNEKLYTPIVAIHKITRLIENKYLFTSLDKSYK
jgi:hypothetical protein